MEQTYHFFLAAIRMSYADENGETMMAETNTVIQSETNSLTVAHFARCQNQTVANLSEKMGMVPKMQNFVFLSINYLGENTGTEFFQTANDEVN